MIILVQITIIKKCLKLISDQFRAVSYTHLVFIVLLISSAVSKGQIYKYIGLEDGLNNQKIYHIQKDRRDICGF